MVPAQQFRRGAGRTRVQAPGKPAQGHGFSDCPQNTQNDAEKRVWRFFSPLRVLCAFCPRASVLPVICSLVSFARLLRFAPVQVLCHLKSPHFQQDFSSRLCVFA